MFGHVTTNGYRVEATVMLSISAESGLTSGKSGATGSDARPNNALVVAFEYLKTARISWPLRDFSANDSQKTSGSLCRCLLFAGKAFF